MKANQEGFTLIEVLVSLTMFAIVAAIPLGFLNQARYNRSSGERIGAIAVAQQQLDYLRLQDIGAIPNNGTVQSTMTTGGNSYLVRTTYCATAAYCASVNNRHIRVEVYGSDRKLFSTETVFTQLK